MSRERAKALAALAVDPASTPHEADNARRILARLIHEHPEIIGPEPIASNPAGVDATIDPIVGMAVRQAAGIVGDLMRDFLERRATRAKRPPPPARNANACPVCGGVGASLAPRIGLSRFLRCAAGHQWTHPEDAPKKAAPKKRAAMKPGPKKAAPK